MTDHPKTPARDRKKEDAVLRAVEALMTFWGSTSPFQQENLRLAPDVFAEIIHNLMGITLGYQPSLWTCFLCAYAHLDAGIAVHWEQCNWRHQSGVMRWSRWCISCTTCKGLE